MSYAKLPTTDQDLESQSQLPLEDLPAYSSTSTSSTVLNHDISSISLNHDHASLLALAKSHNLTTADVQFLADQPEFAAPDVKKAYALFAKVFLGFFGFFFVVFFGGFVFTVIMAITGHL
jgi:hypothetical protein